MADSAEAFPRATARGGMHALSVVGRWASVTLEGELDLANADQIPAVARALSARGVSECLIDLGRVTFLDVSVLNALHAADRVLTGHGGRLLIVGLSPLATRALRLTGLDQLLPAWTPETARGNDVTAAERLEAHAEALDDAVATLAAPGDGSAALAALFRRIAGTATATVPGCTAASCGLVVLGTARTAAPSDPLAAQLDVAQYELGRGPCLRAMGTGRQSTLRDGTPEERENLARHGVEEAFSVPLRLAGHVVGSLNCYGAGRSFLDEAAPSVEALGAAAGRALETTLGAVRPPPQVGRP